MIQNFDDRGHPTPLNSLLLSSVQCVLEKKKSYFKKEEHFGDFKIHQYDKRDRRLPKRKLPVKIMLWFGRGGRWGIYAGCFLRAFLNTLPGALAVCEAICVLLN